MCSRMESLMEGPWTPPSWNLVARMQEMVQRVAQMLLMEVDESSAELSEAVKAALIPLQEDMLLERGVRSPREGDRKVVVILSDNASTGKMYC